MKRDHFHHFCAKLGIYYQTFNTNRFVNNYFNDLVFIIIINLLTHFLNNNLNLNFSFNLFLFILNNFDITISPIHYKDLSDLKHFIYLPKFLLILSII